MACPDLKELLLGSVFAGDMPAAKAQPGEDNFEKNVAKDSPISEIYRERAGLGSATLLLLADLDQPRPQLVLGERVAFESSSGTVLLFLFLSVLIASSPRATRPLRRATPRQE